MVGYERLEENHDHILKELLLWNVKREKNAVWAWKERQREKGASAFKPNGERERCPVKRKGSRKTEHPTDFPSPQVQIGAHCASSPVSWGCESGGRGRMVERETESRIIFARKRLSFWLLSASPVPDPYLEFFFLEKMRYAGGTHVAVPRLYPYLSSTRYEYGT